jgi:methylenetetrahydrofolate dehydrogenase (NADP+)/methenyltetrahydrofolate cyclohydrolase
MSARLLDGKAIAAEVVAEIAEKAKALPVRPGLAVVLVGEDPASTVYVRAKARMAEKLGFYHQQINLPVEVPESVLLEKIQLLNEDQAIHGILVQLPLPRHIRADRVIEAIHPSKDVDGFHPINTGKLWQKRDCFVPCTPAGVIRMLQSIGQDFRGKEAVVVGRSNIVGKPMVALLERLDLTVTLAHSRTRDLAGHVQRADVLVAAVGQPGLVAGDWIKPGAIVLDVGVNRLADGKLVGDVENAGAAGWLSPVPGGVGPMTIAMLMHNTLQAAVGLVKEQ